MLSRAKRSGNMKAFRLWSSLAKQNPPGSRSGHEESLLDWPDTILRHQFLSIGIILRHAGSGDGFAFFNLRGDLLVEGEELGEQIFFRAEAVGGEDSGVERCD